ncbi:MAG: hypothetical protein V2A71_03180, partial [Candidatus Eisenbacteria bacterium]
MKSDVGPVKPASVHNVRPIPRVRSRIVATSVAQVRRSARRMHAYADVDGSVAEIGRPAHRVRHEPDIPASLAYP